MVTEQKWLLQLTRRQERLHKNLGLGTWLVWLVQGWLATIMDSTSGSASVVSSRLVGSAVMDSSGSSASVVSSLMVDSVNVDRSASVMMELMESETICNYIIIIIATSPHSSRL